MRRLVCLIKIIPLVFCQFVPTWINSNIKPKTCCEIFARAVLQTDRRDLAQPQVAPFTQLLLDHGADPNIRASLRKKLHPGYGPKYDVETTYEYRNVTPLGWGRQFHPKVFVSEPAMRLIEEHGGVE